MELKDLQALRAEADTKIVLLVLDGLGGQGRQRGGQTALERADTPTLDRLAREGITGLHEPVAPGITPGSGPGHLALFGYDPLRYRVGRGVLAALGIGHELAAGEVAARGNFCTLDEAGQVTDRRAGRIGTELNEELVAALEGISIDGCEITLKTVKGHRFLLTLRGARVGGGALSDTDPQQTGVAPERCRAHDEGSTSTAELVNEWVAAAQDELAGREPANGVLLRGFASKPDWPTLPDIYGVRALCVAGYPMYRGVSRLVGMEAAHEGDSILEGKIALIQERWDDHDFFFLHVKETDAAGEDGDFDGRVEVIEQVDRELGGLLDLGPDVLFVTGDHSTPARHRNHSWHPVPTLIHAESVRADPVTSFGERACLGGALGPRFPGYGLMPLVMAHAGRLEKYGA